MSNVHYGFHKIPRSPERDLVAEVRSDLRDSQTWFASFILGLWDVVVVMLLLLMLIAIPLAFSFIMFLAR